MCEICKNSVNRDYTHSKSKYHRKLLYKIMKIKKNTNFYDKGDLTQIPSISDIKDI